MKYLGEFRISGGDSTPTSNNIMLEYGEHDLDEYLADTYAPVLSQEIIEFWTALFKVAETLRQMHDLNYEEHGQSRVLRG